MEGLASFTKACRSERGLTKIWAARSTTAIQRIARLITADVADGRIKSTIDSAAEAGRLFALVQGMSFQSLVDPPTGCHTACARWLISNSITCAKAPASRRRTTAVGRRATPAPVVTGDHGGECDSSSALVSCPIWRAPQID